MKNGIDEPKISLNQARDTGMAMVLISLLLAAGVSNRFIGLAICLLVVTMIRPQLFSPLAVVWFGLSRVLGSIMSRFLLTLVFFSVVLPIAVIRRLFGADPLQLKQWRRASSSVFSDRQQTYTAADLEKPY